MVRCLQKFKRKSKSHCSKYCSSSGRALWKDLPVQPVFYCLMDHPPKSIWIKSSNAWSEDECAKPPLISGWISSQADLLPWCIHRNKPKKKPFRIPSFQKKRFFFLDLCFILLYFVLLILVFTSVHFYVHTSIWQWKSMDSYQKKKTFCSLVLENILWATPRDRRGN